MLRQTPKIMYQAPNGADGRRIPYPPTIVDSMTAEVANVLHKDKHLIVWVNAPYWASMIPNILRDARAILGSKVTLIYDVLDDFTGFSDLAPHTVELQQMHDIILRDSDIITYTARRMESSLAPHAHKTVYLPNACDPGTWDIRRRKEDRPIVGYFGVVAEWFDLSTLATIARTNDVKIEIVGPVNRDLGRTLKLTPNVEYLGIKHHSELPHIAARWSCAIIPFKKTELTDSTDPVKLYEFMAAGLPIVATDLDEITTLSQTMEVDAKPVLIKQGQARMFARSVKRMIETDSEQKRNARKKWAMEHSWEARANRVVRAIGLEVIV